MITPKLTSTKRRPLFARFYRKVAPLMERRGLAGQRERLLSGLAGDVIEIGAGDGRNLAHFPTDLTRVLAVEPEPVLRERALANAAAAPFEVEVVDGVAERLDVPDATFDAAVVTLVLCSVDDPPGALQELYRVVRPGGKVRFLEHVRAGRPAAAAVQRAVDATFWPTLNGGCHTSRDTLSTITGAGFRLERHRRLGVRDTGVPFPASPTIAGIAVRPGVEEGA